MKHKMYILSRHGDTTVEWEPTNAVETAIAARHFRDKASGGFAAFAGKPNETPVHVRVFNPLDEEIVFVPQIAGGR